jgi:putative endopeptidase
MQNVWDIETILANASMTRVELRDPEKTYHLFTIDQLKKTYSNIDWDAFFKVMNTKPFNEVVVSQPDFLRVYDSILPAISHDKWVSYQYFHLINSNARYLSSQIVNNRFNFYGKVLSGTTVIEPRWKRVSYVAGNYMRDLIGQEYVKTNFSPNAKERALELVENLRQTLSDRISALTWMNDTTKAKAQEKLSKIMVKIGYPDKWWSYDGLDVKKQAYVLNVLACTERENRRVLEKIGSPIDRAEWGMGPQTVNAYYNPLLNEIVFPAAILQPPFFYEFGDDAVNYGGIGMVIGHEITHGFDDEGSQFDAEGNLSNWWTAGDKQNYEKLTDHFVKQYGQYKVADSVYVNGELTLGENIADLGGMNITYSAMHKALENKKVPLIDGLTPDQRLFINYALIWREAIRPEFLKQLTYTDGHSPSKFRVNGVLSNFTPFYKAFNLTPANKLFTKEEDMSKMW